MKELNFPKMTAQDIDVRVGSGGKDGMTYADLLLYKDARVDMTILDKVVGAFNWKREHTMRENLINGARKMVNYCKVSIWDDDKKEWVSKEDCGVESMTEAVKGESSDAFKRACFNWGIGRELYTAPHIRIDLTANDYNKYGKLSLRFTCTHIGYDNEGNINALTIVDNYGRVRFSRNAKEGDVVNAIAWVNRQTTITGLSGVYNACPELHNNKEFMDALSAKKLQIMPAQAVESAKTDNERQSRRKRLQAKKNKGEGDGK